MIPDYAAQRRHRASPLFDPTKGVTVVAPPGEGPGYWAGAPSVLEAEGEVYLAYRLRRPRGVEPDRGAELYLARSADGVSFEDFWVLHKDQLESPSMERACLVRRPEGDWLLYVSYVDGADGRWRIDVLPAADPAGFDPARRREVFTAASSGTEGVKDPYVVQVEGRYHMLLSMARGVGEGSEAEKHATGDIMNTGLCLSTTALATSADGLSWEWQGEVLSPTPGAWDAYCTRVTALLWRPPVWVAFYDGSASVAENYEERGGLAVSRDLRSFARLTPAGPALSSPQGGGGVRYLDCLDRGDEVLCYYEYTRPEGSHELRCSRLSGGES